MFTNDELPVVSGCDRSPAARLAREHSGLVDFVIKRRFPFLLNDADARQAARVALWRAGVSFDPSQGYSFTTYAVKCVRGGILRYLKFDSARREAKRLPIAGSLDETVEPDSDLTRGEVIPDANSAAGYAAICARENLRSMSLALKGKRRAVFVGLYLEGDTIGDLAARWKVTPSNVGALHRGAIQDIKKRCPEHVRALQCASS